MPQYEQKCPRCDYEFEVERRITDEVPVICPKCGSVTTRLISRTSFKLKDGPSGGWADKSYAPPKPPDPKPASPGKKEL